MRNILYVNATIRKESRTNELAKYLLKQMEGNITEIHLEEEYLNPLNRIRLSERESAIKNNEYMNENLKYAVQFANADSIVIAAPFWDLSFPAILKTYIENVSVTNVTFKYGEDGIPIGLCKASEIYFVSTAGGVFLSEFGYNYVKTIGEKLFGIKNSKLIYAEGLDIIGNNVQEIMNKAKEEIDEILKSRSE